MIGKIKRFLGLSASQEVMTRWSPEKLASIKTYLEGKPEESLTKEDHYLAVEWSMQRYLPKDIDRTEADHRQILASLNKKVDANVARMERGDAVPVQAVTPDPDFAAWLKETLRRKIDREDILKQLSYFEPPFEDSRQAHAIKMFNFWVDEPDHFDIDLDLRVKIEEVLKTWGGG